MALYSDRAILSATPWLTAGRRAVSAIVVPEVTFLTDAEVMRWAKFDMKYTMLQNRMLLEQYEKAWPGIKESLKTLVLDLTQEEDVALNKWTMREEMDWVMSPLDDSSEESEWIL